MRGGYSGFTHRTIVSHPLQLWSHVHSPRRRPPQIVPRCDERRNGARRAIRDDRQELSRTGSRWHIRQTESGRVTLARIIRTLACNCRLDEHALWLYQGG